MDAKPIGIDAISAYIPRLYVDMDKWCTNMAVSTDSVDKLRDKVTNRIGITQMAMMDYHEDPVTMAANAVRSLINKTKIRFRDIGAIYVGTESSVDQAKPISAYLLGILQAHYEKDLSHINCVQVQFACVGATYALEFALNSLRAGTSEYKYQIVVATDEAKYPLSSSGEPTQGAGAVAMLICETPGLVELELDTIGTCSMDRNDFFRPNFAKSAVVNGKESIVAYLDCIEKAVERFFEKSAEEDIELDSFQHFLFHVPFPKMAEYAAARLFRCFGKNGGTDVSKYNKILSQSDSYSVAKEERLIRSDGYFRQVFKNRIESSLLLSRKIGNIYSGSLYLSLVSLLEHASMFQIPLGNRNILFTSYGGGACAKVFKGKFIEKPLIDSKLAGNLNVVRDEDFRHALSFEEYRKLHQHLDFALERRVTKKQHGDEILPVIGFSDELQIKKCKRPRSILKPWDEFVLDKISDDSSTSGYRYYSFAK